MTEWQPIETAPRDGTRILCYSPKGPNVEHKDIIEVTWWRQEKDKRGFVGWGEFNPQFWPPTHWMPLPKPPAPTNDDFVGGSTNSESA